MINFLKKLPEEQKNEESMKVIIENMNQLCKKIMNNDVINAIKERYIVKRKEIEKHIKFIKLLNNFNVCNSKPNQIVRFPPPPRPPSKFFVF